MTWRKHIRPDEKVSLKLTATERKLVLEGLHCLDREYEQIARKVPAGKPVMMTLDELDDFGGCVADEANHTVDKKLQKKFDSIYQKIQKLLETYTVEEPPRILKIEESKKATLISDQALQLAEWPFSLVKTMEKSAALTTSLRTTGSVMAAATRAS